MQRLKQYLLRYEKSYIFGAIFTIIGSLTALAIPWILKYVIDGISKGISYSILIKYSALIVAVSILEGVFRFLMRKTTITASRQIEYDLRNDYFKHLQKLPLPFYDQHNTGDLMSRGTNDLNDVRMLLGPGIMYSTETVATFLFAFAMMLLINIKLSLLSILPLIILSVFIARMGRLLQKNYLTVQEKMGDLSRSAQEYISGIKVIKAFVQEKTTFTNFSQSSKSYFDANLKIARIWSAFFPLMFLMSGLSTIIVLLLGGRAVILHEMTLGELVAFSGFLAILVWPMMALGWAINLFQAGFSAMKRIEQVLGEPRPFSIEEKHQNQKERGEESTTSSIAIEKIHGEAVRQSFSGGIEFRKLFFTYANDSVPVLKNINLKIYPGETIALMGKVGSGKTTLVNLIPHLYSVQKGMLFIDGRDINDIPLHTLRKNIGFVSQEPFLFSNTVKNNLIFGIPDKTSGHLIEETLEISQLANEVNNFPDKLETLLGERGINFSGGQKQRLAMARALIINPSILILDDCFSSMDTETEKFIIERLSDVIEKKTTIIISHRTSSIRRAKRIIVLDQCEIAEQGTHEELLAKNGLYAELYQLESLKEELENKL